jgi:hypothetical protein
MAALHGRFDTIVTTSHPLKDGPAVLLGARRFRSARALS